MRGKTAAIYSLISIVLMLGLVGCERTIEGVAKWKAKGNVEKLIGGLADPKPEIRKASATALGELKAAAAVEPLAALFADPNPQLVLTATEALASIGNEPAQTHLIAALKIESGKVRTVAVTSLGAFKCVRAIDPLAEALNDPFDEIACAAATSLGQIGDERAIKPLAARVKHRSAALRLACVKSLGSIGGESTLESLALALGDIGGDLRQTAIDALVAIGKPSIPYALTALRDNDELTRQSGIAVLKGADAVPTIGSDLVWYRLAQIPTGKNDGVNTSTVQQLAEMGNDALEALLEAAAHNTPNIREHAFQALETIGEPCAAQAAAAADAHAGNGGKQWFNGRATWKGAPSWRIDLWGAATSLNPAFELNSVKAAELQTKGIDARRVMSSTLFQVSREYIPLLIGQLDFRTKQKKNPEGSEPGKPNAMQSALQTLVEPHLELAKKRLVSAGDLAVLPLIAALGDSNPQVVESCAEILGEIGDKRAITSLIEILSQKIDAGEQLTSSSFYIALLKLDDPSAEPVLLKVRPNDDRGKRVFERQYSGTSVISTRSHDATAHHTKPVAFTLGYHKGEKIGEYRITFAKDANGDWVPTPPLPEQLPE